VEGIELQRLAADVILYYSIPGLGIATTALCHCEYAPTAAIFSLDYVKMPPGPSTVMHNQLQQP
jgi:hypothetical protein